MCTNLIYLKIAGKNYLRKLKYEINKKEEADVPSSVGSHMAQERMI